MAIPDRLVRTPVRRASGAPPLWRQVRDDIESRLARGAFAEAFPAEFELVEQYQVSRHTIRQALRGLREDGLVVAGPGRPSRAADAGEVTLRLGGVYSLFDSVTAAGISQRSIVQTLESRAEAAAARRLGLRARSLVLCLDRLRMVGSEPLALDSVRLPGRLAARLLEADLTTTSLYAAYAELCDVHVVDARESIRACTPSDTERLSLDIEPDTPVLTVERTGFDSTRRRVEWRRTTVRADRIQLCSEDAGRHGYRPELLLPTTSDTEPAF